MQTQHADTDLWFTTAHLRVRQPRNLDTRAPSLLEHWMAHDFAPPQHVHHDEDETFYILEGRFRFETRGQVRELGAGEAIHMPRGIAHGFRVVSPEGGRCLTITHGGFEDMVRAASRPAPGPCLPEQAPPTPEQQASLAATCEAHGISLVAPPIA